MIVEYGDTSVEYRTPTTPAGLGMRLEVYGDDMYIGRDIHGTRLHLYVDDSFMTLSSPSGRVQIPAGEHTELAAVAGGTLHVQTTPATNATPIETALQSWTLPANVLSHDGMRLHVKAWGMHAPNTVQKDVRLYWGPTVVSATSGLFNNLAWVLEADIIRTGPAAQETVGTSALYGFAFGYCGPATVPLDAPVPIVLTGLGGVTARGLLVEFWG